MSERTLREYRKQATRYVRPVHSARSRWRRSPVTTSNGSPRRWRRLRHNGIAPSPSSRGCSHLPSIGSGAASGPTRVRGVERAKEEARDRVLEPSELARLNAALADLETDHPFPVAAIRVAAMTGLRDRASAFLSNGRTCHSRLGRVRASEDEDRATRDPTRHPRARTAWLTCHTLPATRTFSPDCAAPPSDTR